MTLRPTADDGIRKFPWNVMVWIPLEEAGLADGEWIRAKGSIAWLFFEAFGTVLVACVAVVEEVISLKGAPNYYPALGYCHLNIYRCVHRYFGDTL
jgi:hypothetical protein